MVSLGNTCLFMGIQTLWQEEMMIEHGHQGGVELMQPLGQMEKN